MLITERMTDIDTKVTNHIMVLRYGKQCGDTSDQYDVKPVNL